jgi:erythromycin esterase-like protein
MTDLDVQRDALPLTGVQDLGPLLDRIGEASFVLVGEASHGTHGFYAWRAELTRRLIAERGFGFVGVEGDWPDCERVHRAVTSDTDPFEALYGFRRWPTSMWGNLLAAVARTAPTDESGLGVRQHAEALAGAERYYRAMVRGGPESWNVRDVHMADTMARLAEFHDPKGVVWAHNTHIGDARATDMAAAGMTSLGQLARERHGDDAVLVGFGTYRGTVVAGDQWGAQHHVMPIPPARPASLEALLHELISAVRRSAGRPRPDLSLGSSSADPSCSPGTGHHPLTSSEAVADPPALPTAAAPLH